MDPFAAALGAAASAARGGSKRPRYDDAPGQPAPAQQYQQHQPPPHQQPPQQHPSYAAPGMHAQYQQWGDQSQAGPRGYAAYQPQMHGGGYARPPPGQQYMQPAPHMYQGQPPQGMQQPYGGGQTMQQPGPGWGGPAAPAPAHPAHAAHSYGARMAYGAGPSEDARRHRGDMDHHRGKRRDDGGRGYGDDQGPRKHEVPCVA